MTALSFVWVHPYSQNSRCDSNNNFFFPDSSNRCIHEIRDKVFHAGYLDETSGQFYAVYGNTYQQMSTKPMLEQSWRTGELIDQLAVT